MLLYDKYDPQDFVDALGIEMQSEPDVQKASEIVCRNLDNDPKHYKRKSSQYSLVGVGSDGRVYMRKNQLEKGRKAAIGEVREYKGVKKKKVADGKWVPVEDGAKKPVEEKKKKTKSKKPGEEKPKIEEEEAKEQQKSVLKTALKKIMTVFADVLSAKGGGQAAAQTVEETGEGAENKTRAKVNEARREDVKKRNAARQQAANAEAAKKAGEKK
jgi:hypothetical protein